MIPGEQFYTSLKHLVSLPQWKDYEAWLQNRQDQIFQELLHGVDEKETLEGLQARVREIEKIKSSIHQLISEVEESRKGGRI